MRTRTNSRIAAAAAALILSACATTAPPAPEIHLAAPPPAIATPAALHQALSTRKGAFTDALQSFYAARDFRPAWSNDADAAELTRVLSHAHEQGLRDEEYLVPAAAPASSTQERASRDIALTEAAMRYARDVQQGRVLPASVYEDVALPATTFDAGDALNSAIAKHEIAGFFAARAPSHRGYRNLVTALAHYRALAVKDPKAQARVHQIEANMERWRWLPRQMESRFVMVNAPDQSVAFIRDGKAELTSRVIVGRKNSPTPITRTEIQAVVVNPPWNIPGDIAARDLLPHLKQNANYLQTRHMVLTDGPKGDPYGRKIDWRKITPADFPYAVRQLPGPETALGQLMLDSPNDFDVYLHDTPNRKIFAQDDRQVSNGCVRVQQIFPLASLALMDDAERGQAKLRQAVKAGKTQRLPLASPLPVYFAYWTAVADDDGEVQFRPDIYDRDAPLIAALAGKPTHPARLIQPPAEMVDVTP